LLFGALAVLVPVLTGCEAGLNAPTLQFHPAGNGATAQANGVSISNLFVLGPPLQATLPLGGRAGAFAALSSTGGDQLTSVSAPGTAASVRLIGGPVTLRPGSLVTLTGPRPSIVLAGLTRTLRGGQTIRLVFSFANAGPVSILVPVLPHAYEYATFSPPAAPLPARTPPTAGGSSSPAPTASASQGGNQPTSSPSPSATP
jgi:hypothetical protein